MKNTKKKIEEISRQCGFCTAEFEIWLDNSRFNQDREERLHGRFLKFCPVCARIDEKY